jgi:hypothetical protein
MVDCLVWAEKSDKPEWFTSLVHSHCIVAAEGLANLWLEQTTDYKRCQRITESGTSTSSTLWTCPLKQTKTRQSILRVKSLKCRHTKG